jgi:hypothetical protein
MEMFPTIDVLGWIGLAELEAERRGGWAEVCQPNGKDGKDHPMVCDGRHRCAILAGIWDGFEKPW